MQSIELIVEWIEANYKQNFSYNNESQFHSFSTKFDYQILVYDTRRYGIIISHKKFDGTQISNFICQIELPTFFDDLKRYLDGCSIYY